MSVIALTGGTGFVGRRLIERMLDAGHQVRALTRRPRAYREGVCWVEGALDKPEALHELASGADAVIHVAGAVNAPDRLAFAAANIEGTGAMLSAARSAGVSRFVHVSSLAAREPSLSAYGWSKAEGDKLVIASGLNWTIVRPPAVYGPGDTELLELFRMVKWRIAMLPPGGRMAIIHVDDLSRLLLSLALSASPRAILEPSDGTPGGFSHPEFARAIAAAMGHSVLPLPLPKPMLRLAAAGDKWARRDKAKLTPDRVDYFCHPDWTANPAKAPPTQLWQPEIPAAMGLAETAAWYRDQSLL